MCATYSDMTYVEHPGCDFTTHFPLASSCLFYEKVSRFMTLPAKHSLTLWTFWVFIAVATTFTHFCLHSKWQPNLSKVYELVYGRLHKIFPYRLLHVLWGLSTEVFPNENIFFMFMWPVFLIQMWFTSQMKTFFYNMANTDLLLNLCTIET